MAQRICSASAWQFNELGDSNRWQEKCVLAIRLACRGSDCAKLAWPPSRGNLRRMEGVVRATKNPSQADDLRHDEIVSELAGCEGLVPPRHRRTVICPNRIRPTMYETPDLSQLDMVNRAGSRKFG